MREKTLNQWNFCDIMEQSRNDFNIAIDIQEKRYNNHTLKANMNEALCLNDRNHDAKNNMVLKIMKMIGLMIGPVDYDRIIEKEKMIPCLCNNMIFENEANITLIRGYLRDKGKMENVFPSMSWDSKKWISLW